MMCKKKIIGAALLALCVNSHAGFYATTIHSRANCMNNESITWWFEHSYNWRVYSFHWYDWRHQSKGYHLIDTKMGYTWRQAAVHWNEQDIRVKGYWMVHGNHYYQWDRFEVLDNTTDVTDCSLYNGWWDR